jgi:hypothetical protein
MTLFEYLAIAFSLLFSFSVMRLIGGLPHALNPDRRYWIHLCLVLIQLTGTAVVFWAFWSYREVEWTFARFLLALASPSLIYFASCTLVPEDPASVESWRSYYYSSCRKYFLCLSVWALVVAIAVTVLVQMPITHPARIAQTGVFVAGLIGASSSEARVHGGIVALFLCLIVFVFLTYLMRPGSLVT